MQNTFTHQIVHEQQYRYIIQLYTNNMHSKELIFKKWQRVFDSKEPMQNKAQTDCWLASGSRSRTPNGHSRNVQYKIGTHGSSSSLRNFWKWTLSIVLRQSSLVFLLWLLETREHILHRH